MPRTTRRWIIPAVAGVLLLAGIAEFTYLHPGLALAAALIVYMFTRLHLPLSYTVDELRQRRDPVAGTLARWLPLVILFALCYGTWRWSFGLALTVLYVGDRITARVIRMAVAARQRRQARRVHLEDLPPVAANEAPAGVRDEA